MKIKYIFVSTMFIISCRGLNTNIGGGVKEESKSWRKSFEDFQKIIPEATDKIDPFAIKELIRQVSDLQSVNEGLKELLRKSTEARENYEFTLQCSGHPGSGQSLSVTLYKMETDNSGKINEKLVTKLVDKSGCPLTTPNPNGTTTDTIVFSLVPYLIGAGNYKIKTNYYVHHTREPYNLLYNLKWYDKQSQVRYTTGCVVDIKNVTNEGCTVNTNNSSDALDCYRECEFQLKYSPQ